MDEAENKNHLLGGISPNVNEMQFEKLLRGAFFTERGSPSSEEEWGGAADSAVWGKCGGCPLRVEMQRCITGSTMFTLNKQKDSDVGVNGKSHCDTDQTSLMHDQA